MKYLFLSLVILCMSMVSCFGQEIRFEETTTFYPENQFLAEEDILWGYAHVPENWEDDSNSMIKVAVTVLKATSDDSKPDPVVFIQGGPGAGAIANLRLWTRHPLRESHDIVMFDTRGTGFSEPRLCPDLGQELLKILAKNQSEEKDEEDKAAAALLCKQEMLNKDIDIYAYNSLSIARDLHGIMSMLDYEKWNAYGVSYGTHVAQVYASQYPQDISTLTLDSFIPDISEYYTGNTSGYMKGLEKVITYCEGDPECKANYPDLKKVFYETIEELEENPITVEVDKNLIESGEFTYNAEDFKVAVQQALYHKNLVTIVPLLIYQVHNRNEDALGNLVQAFSALLAMDYGVYFAMSCNEALPANQITAYRQDAAAYSQLSGGISFYKSDFNVCEAWNKVRPDSSFIPADIVDLSETPFPILLFSGEYDPITPPKERALLDQHYSNYQYVLAYTYGHIPGFTLTGRKVAQEFVNNPKAKVDTGAFENDPLIAFVKNVQINPGVAQIGNSLNQMNFVFLTPLIIALLIMVVFIFVYLLRIIKRKYVFTDMVVRGMSTLLSLVGICGFVLLVLALLEVLGQNFYILAFGLPAKFSYVFTVLQVFGILLILTVLFFAFRIRKLSNRSVIFSLLFSNIILLSYLLYWHLI